MSIAKNKSHRYPIETGFYSTMTLTTEDKEFLRGRMAFFNYLVEQVENNSQKLDKVLELLMLQTKHNIKGTL